MCILFAHRNPKAIENSYRLIVASNRDEICKRPAKPARYWEKHLDCLGGIDDTPGKEGGSWFALSTRGRVGAVLNLSLDDRPNAGASGKGRGCLVVDYVTSEDSAEHYLQTLHDVNQKFQTYNPHNLILMNMRDASLDYLSSSPSSPGPQKYHGDIFGVSNSPIERPYAKVRAGMEEMRRIVTGARVSDRDKLIQDLLQLLKSKKRHLPDPELQKKSPEWYEALSSIYVYNEKIDYRTRSHSILMVDASDNVTFVEETKITDGSWKSQIFETVLENR